MFPCLRFVLPPQGSWFCSLHYKPDDCPIPGEEGKVGRGLSLCYTYQVGACKNLDTFVAQPLPEKLAAVSRLLGDV